MQDVTKEDIKKILTAKGKLVPGQYMNKQA